MPADVRDPRRDIADMLRGGGMEQGKVERTFWGMGLSRAQAQAVADAMWFVCDEAIAERVTTGESLEG